jgi:D-alanyl-D-alanine carboxypeptidase (penicillin-binding protein 5/6)
MYHAENGSTVQVQAGEAITEYQALQAMLLPSANNMADSLADWAFGSQTAYVAYANNYVERLGLKNTHITGSSGFDPGTVSTASDLIRLGAAALTSPILASIASQTSANVPVNGLVHNVNFALGTDGTIGIKTGNIDQDPGVYLFASKDQINSKQSAILVGAIMGGPTLTKVINDSIPLINSLKADFSSSPLLRSGQIVGEYQLPWNRQIVPAVAEDNLFPVIWKAIPVKLNLVLSKERSPIPQGTMVGVATSIGVTGLKVSTSIVLSKPIAKPPIAWRLLHPFGLGL